MKKNIKLVSIGILMVFMLVIGNAQANEDDVKKNIPITADEAFDAYAEQVDPLSGDTATVIIVDVRTRAEHRWVGAPAEVDSIITKTGKEFLPHNGKVKLRMGGRYLKFQVEKGNRLHPVFLPVNRVESTVQRVIAYNIPLKTWDEESCSLIDNPDFIDQMNKLVKLDEYNNGVVLILMCRSGIRSNTTIFDTGLFKEVYEIDQPDGTDGRGGFEGTSYNNVYNGYRGFPGRHTRNQESPSVSWTDTGLPILTSKCTPPPSPE